MTTIFKSFLLLSLCISNAHSYCYVVTSCEQTISQEYIVKLKKSIEDAYEDLIDAQDELIAKKRRNKDIIKENVRVLKLLVEFEGARVKLLDSSKYKQLAIERDLKNILNGETE